MKTYLKWTLSLLVVGLISYLAWGFISKLQRKQESSERVKVLPDFRAYTIDRSEISKATLAERPAVLIYFDPDCDHCHREADELHKKAALLAPAQVLMLSSAGLPEIKRFMHVHPFNVISNVRVAYIDRQIAYETFGFASVPDVLIYHADGSLAKRFQGETSVEAIARHL